MSGARGTVRKTFDIAPTAITSNGNYDGSSAPTTAWTNGTLTTGIWLTGIIQSDDDNGRIGQSVALETFDLMVNITPDSAANVGCRLRMIVVADNEYDGMNSAASAAPPLLSEVLGVITSTTTPSVASGLFLTRLNPQFYGRFHVIEDKRWAWTTTAATEYTFDTSSTHSWYHQTYKDMHDHRLLWDQSDNSLVSSARKGHIFMYFIFEQNSPTTGGIPAVTTTYPPAIQYSLRLRYRDA